MERVKVGDWLIRPSDNSISNDSESVFIEPKAMALLLLLVEAKGETLSREYIIETIWARKYVNDSALNNLVSSLRRYLNKDKVKETYIRTRPKLGYQLIANIEYLDEAHAKDIKTNGANANSKRKPIASKKYGLLSGLAIIFLVFITAFFVNTGPWSSAQSSTDVINAETRPSQDENVNNTSYSIAVLPFIWLNNESENDFFAEGLASEIIHQLNVVPNFKVVSRRSSFQFKDSAIDTKRIGEQLNVDFILEGSVRELENVFRVTLQLVQAIDGKVIWSQAFSANKQNNFAIQHQISAEIAATLDASFTGIPNEKRRYRASSSEAYLHVLRGRRLNQIGTAEAHLQARDEFLMATLLEPQYAAAYVDLAVAYLSLQSQKRLNYDEGQKLATDAINKALAIDPELAEAHAAIGYLYNNTFQFDKAEVSYKKALSSNPNLYVALINYANLKRRQYQIEDAYALYTRAVELAPLSSAAHWGVSNSLIGLGRLDDAIASAQTCALRAPKSSSCYYSLAYASRLNHQHALADEALSTLHTLVSADDYTFLMVQAWHALWFNQLQDADAIFADLTNKYGFNISGLQTLSFVQFGMNKQAEWLARLEELSNPFELGLAIRANYGHAAYFNQQCETAISFYEHVLNENPNLLTNRDIQANGVSYAANLSYCYKKLGESKKAKEMLLSLENAINTYPKSNHFVPGIAYLRAQYHVLNDDLDEANEWVEQLKSEKWALLWLLERDPILSQ